MDIWKSFWPWGSPFSSGVSCEATGLMVYTHLTKHTFGSVILTGILVEDVNVW